MRRPWIRLCLLALLLASPARADLALLARAHSHNDYAQRHPLVDALAQGFSSVEADIWWTRGALRVSHLGVFFKGTLEELYLRPLQERVDRLGSVYGDGKPFYLWIDVKSDDPWLVVELYDLLERYSMLSVFTDGGVAQGPVTVILTGLDEPKRRYVDDYPIRRATRDADAVAASDGPASPRWQWYALDWQRSWMKDPSRLEELVREAHALGRRVRVYGLPDHRGEWWVALRAGVDLIGGDELRELHDFLAGLPQGG